MQRTRTMLAMAVAMVTVTATAQAEVLSLTTASELDFKAGALNVDAGASLGDITFLGGRVAYAAADNLLIFGDAGLADWDDVDDQDGPSIGGGAILAIDVALPFALGAKGSYHLFSADDVDTTDIALGVVAAGDCGTIGGLTWFANLGVHLLEVEVDAGPFGSFERDDTEIGFGGGVIYAVSEQVDVFVGIDHVDDTYLSGGLRWTVE